MSRLRKISPVETLLRELGLVQVLQTLSWSFFLEQESFFFYLSRKQAFGPSRDELMVIVETIVLASPSLKP